MSRHLRLLTAPDKSPEALLVLLSLALPLSFATWQALLNNFAIERAAFSGAEIGILQSLREIPGFLAFTAVFILLFLREQRFILVATLFLGVGTAITGLFPSALGLYVTTVIMSIGFHYFETLRQSLALQWVPKERAAGFLGDLISVQAFAGLISYGLVWMMLELLGLDMAWVYALGGGLTVCIAVYAWRAYPKFEAHVEQNKHLVLRKRYWLYYALTFMAGARRQIFVVFAGFLMVEKFGFDAAAIALMFLANGVINMLFAPAIGRWIGRMGERKTLVLEYIGLIGVFAAYAFVETAWIAVALYIIDHLFFTLSIAIKTYFQKISDPADIASSSGVSFTINHIAAVIIPAFFGIIWLTSPAAVFLIGAFMALISLILSLLVPGAPTPEKVANLFNVSLRQPRHAAAAE